jgi:hypothetical protein
LEARRCSQSPASQKNIRTQNGVRVKRIAAR